LFQQKIHERGFPVIYMSNDGNVSNVINFGFHSLWCCSPFEALRRRGQRGR